MKSAFLEGTDVTMMTIAEMAATKLAVKRILVLMSRTQMDNPSTSNAILDIASDPS
jgi:hypothetical protein